MVMTPKEFSTLKRLFGNYSESDRNDCDRSDPPKDLKNEPTNSTQ